MTREKRQYEQVEVLGDVIYPVIRSISLDALSKSLLERHKLKNVQKRQYYPLEHYLDLLFDMEGRMPRVLQGAGKCIVAEALMPPSSSFEQALMATNDAYYMNHRGFGKCDIGSYRCAKVSDREYLMEVITPYPCAFNMGIFRGYADHFKKHVIVEHAGSSCSAKGDPRCAIRIEIIRQ